MKLYKRMSRFLFHRELSSYKVKRIKWALSLKPGDLINDCSGFNVIVKNVIPERSGFFRSSKGWVHNGRNGWFIYSVNFELDPFGSCDLFSCGVEPPLTAKEITEKMRAWYESWGEPHGGWQYKTEEDLVWQRLKRGECICDERGMRLK
jgi:hypothetical protein